jgi:phosphate transport system substrate-binding protein
MGLKRIPMIRSIFGLLSLSVLSFAIVATACTSPQPTATPQQPASQPTATPRPAAQPTQQTPSAPPTAPVAQLSGTIEVDGSSTVFPITEAVAEEFRKVHPRVQVNVGVSGTGGGFKRFTSGETDMSNASRPIKPAESQAAATNKVDYVELKVAIDGLSVIVNPQNDFVQCLTVAELKKIWEPQSTVNNWSQVRAEFPDRPLRLYGPGTDSGTFDYFTEVVNGAVRASRADYTASEDDNVLVQGVSGDRNALGYFGYAYFEENQDKLKLVAVDGGKGCVKPTAQTIEDGTYSPLSRPLYIYVSKKSLQRPEVKAFVEFFMQNGAKLAAEVGYIPLPSREYTEGLSKLAREISGN